MMIISLSRRQRSEVRSQRSDFRSQISDLKSAILRPSTLNPQPSTLNRPGGILLTVLVCLTIASILFGVMLRTGLAEWRLVRAQERRMQAAWLAESGLARAAARLAADAEYRGETWTITAEELRGNYPAAVRIRVETDAADESRWLIKAQADYPAEGQTRARESRELKIKPKERS
jgi:hypothetical protein